MKPIVHTSRQRFSKISFYIVAHADDWQLFMHPSTFNDLISPVCKVVFIITTAGDGGMDTSFWKAREDGSNSSVRFCLGSHKEFHELHAIKKMNGHDITYWSTDNSVSFFLRLPDGNLDTNGFALGQYQSLPKLHQGIINNISAIDHSTVYNGWADIVKTIETIIQAESEGISEKWLHYINPDRSKNLNDHPDHMTTGLLVQDIRCLDDMQQLMYTGYALQSIGTTLQPAEIFWKAGMMAVYEKAIFDQCGYSTLKENKSLYTQWSCSKPVYHILPPEKFL